MSMGYIKKDDRPKIKKMHKQGYHVETIAKVLRYSPVAIANMIEAYGKIPKWRGEAWKPGGDAAKVDRLAECADPDDPSIGYLPGPDMIRYQCELLKRTWSAAERCRRSGGMDGATGTVDLLENVEVSVSRKGIRGTHQ